MSIAVEKTICWSEVENNFDDNVSISLTDESNEEKNESTHEEVISDTDQKEVLEKPQEIPTNLFSLLKLVL